MIPIILEAEAGESYFRAAWVTQWVYGEAKINTSKLKQASGGGIQDNELSWTSLLLLPPSSPYVGSPVNRTPLDQVCCTVSWSTLKPRTILPAFLGTIYFINPFAVCERCFSRLYVFFPSAWYLVPTGWFGNQGAGIVCREKYLSLKYPIMPHKT